MKWVFCVVGVAYIVAVALLAFKVNAWFGLMLLVPLSLYFD